MTVSEIGEKDFYSNFWRNTQIMKTNNNKYINLIDV